tara:strand:+ start:212 stop:457 length:246 start_codon:yes stop_codon:yes gene_type:complete
MKNLTNYRIMQKIVNVLALVSFVGIVGVVGAGGYVFLQKDAIIKDVTESVLGDVLGDMPAIPEVPATTGGVAPPAGLAIPK